MPHSLVVKYTDKLTRLDGVLEQVFMLSSIADHYNKS